MGNLIAVSLIVIVLGVALFKIYKNKKSSSCGCSCQGCNLKNKCNK